MCGPFLQGPLAAAGGDNLRSLRLQLPLERLAGYSEEVEVIVL